MFETLLRWNLRHKWVGLAVALVIAGLGMSHGVDLPIRLSLADLLPESRESVKDLQAVSEEVGGVGYLILLVGPTEKPEKLLPPLAARLEKIPEIRYTFHEREEYVLRDKALYLLPEREFDDLLEAGKLLLNDGKSGMIDLGLETEAEKKANLRKAKARLARFGKQERPRYFLSNDGHYAMLLAKPVFDSEDLGRSRSLVESVRATMKQEFPALPFELVGRYVDKVNDTNQIETDISKTSVISAFGVLVALVIGMGTFRGSYFTMIAVTIAMAWTLGAARLMVGQINILTGFLLAILGGLGVEYGVHLVRRFTQELLAGKSRAQAIEVSYLQTGRALGSAAITSAAAFLILSFSDFRGFSELGKIAGIGILSIYTVFMLVFPAMAAGMGKQIRFGKLRELFGYFPINRRLFRWLIPPFILACCWGVTQAEFEYNMKRMHNLTKETVERHEFVDAIFGRSFTPAAILAKDGAQALEIEKWLKEAAQKDQVENAISLHRLLPKDMEDRWEDISRLQSKLGRLSDNDLEAKTGMDSEDIRRLLNAKPFSRKDLPPQLNDAFGKSGNIVLVYPAKDLDLAEHMRSFSRVLVQLRERFPGAKIGSDVRIFTEILDHITHDGLIILIIFLVGAFFVMGLDFGNVWDALDLEFQLIAGIFLLVALMGLVGERFSILNIAMVPAVLAAGIDMGVHVRHREREGHGGFPSAKFVAQAVQLSMLTTIIGFGSLFFAQAGMLKGIAWISVLGQISMYLVCMIIWPVYRGNRVRRVPKE